jgi:hypothetical protein
MNRFKMDSRYKHTGMTEWEERRLPVGEFGTLQLGAEEDSVDAALVSVKKEF